MKLERRIENLEKLFLNINCDLMLYLELKEWFESNPKYSPFTQDENNDGVIMPKHLRPALLHWIEEMIGKSIAKSNLCDLRKGFENNIII